MILILTAGLVQITEQINFGYFHIFFVNFFFAVCEKKKILASYPSVEKLFFECACVCLFTPTSVSDLLGQSPVALLMQPLTPGARLVLHPMLCWLALGSCLLRLPFPLIFEERQDCRVLPVLALLLTQSTFRTFVLHFRIESLRHFNVVRHISSAKRNHVNENLEFSRKPDKRVCANLLEKVANASANFSRALFYFFSVNVLNHKVLCSLTVTVSFAFCFRSSVMSGASPCCDTVLPKFSAQDQAISIHAEACKLLMVSPAEHLCLIKHFARLCLWLPRAKTLLHLVWTRLKPGKTRTPSSWFPNMARPVDKQLNLSVWLEWFNSRDSINAKKPKKKQKTIKIKSHYQGSINKQNKLACMTFCVLCLGVLAVHRTPT